MLCLAPVLRQLWCKKEIFEKITIDNQQVTDGGRVLLNPASATRNDITSCNTMSYVVFLFYGATNLRQDRAKSQVYDVKNKTFINFTFVKGRTLVICNITILHS